jgi:hypothetical protein
MKTTDFGKKPVNTRIALTKNGDLLEIYVPPIGFARSLSFIDPAFMLTTIFAIGFALVFAVGSPASPRVLMSYFLPFLASAIGIALLILCPKTYLRIDRNEIRLIQTLFSHKISNRRSMPNLEVTIITFERKHKYKDSEGDLVNKNASLKIETGTDSIALGGIYTGITDEAELEWLAYEISEWLDKPLTIIKSPEY